MTSEKTASRRRHSFDFKAQVMAECDMPGTSVVRVAMSHGINTNVVHGWRKAAREAVSNWLFAGSLRAGQRAAAVMSLLHLARLNDSTGSNRTPISRTY